MPVLLDGFFIQFLIEDVTLSANLLQELHGISFEITSVPDLMSFKTRLQSPCRTPGFAVIFK